jgi:hypothetical protein
MNHARRITVLSVKRRRRGNPPSMDGRMHFTSRKSIFVFGWAIDSAQGCRSFRLRQRCWSVTEPYGYAPSSRLASALNLLQRTSSDL